MKSYGLLVFSLLMCTITAGEHMPPATQSTIGEIPPTYAGKATHGLLADPLMHALAAFLAEDVNENVTASWVAPVLRYNESVQTGEDLLEENDLVMIAQELLCRWDIIEEHLFYEIYKAPRPNVQTINNMVVGANNQCCPQIVTAVSSSSSGGTCDLSGVIAALNALQTLLMECCTTTNANFMSTFTVINGITTTFTTCCTKLTTDFAGTWTMLAALEASADMCGTFTPITSMPFWITAPGNYCFTQSFSVGPNQTGLTITGTRVYVDFNNYVLTVDDTSVGILSTADQTTIANGSIVGGTAGAQGLNDMFVATNMTFSGQLFGAGEFGSLAITGTACSVCYCSFASTQLGINTNNTTALTINNCIFNNITTLGLGSSIAVLLSTSLSFCIKDCAMNTVDNEGISIEFSSNGFVQNCLFQNVNNALAIISSNNIVVNDCISNGGFTGFGISDSTNIALIRCQASAATGILSGQGIGLLLQTFGQNVSGIAIHNCISSSNAVSGLSCSVNGGFSIDTLSIQNCIFSGNTSFGLNLLDTSSSVIANCDFTANGVGCFLETCFGIGLYHNTAANNGTDGFSLLTSFSCIHRYNEASNNGAFGFIADSSTTCTYYNNFAFDNGSSSIDNFNGINGVTGNVVTPGSSLDISSTGSAQQLVYNISTS